MFYIPAHLHFTLLAYTHCARALLTTTSISNLQLRHQPQHHSQPASTTTPHTTLKMPYINLTPNLVPPRPTPAHDAQHARDRTTKVLYIFYFLLFTYGLHLGAYLGAPSCAANKSQCFAPVYWDPVRAHVGVRVAKATVLHGAPNDVYQQALWLHWRQNDEFGYKMHVEQGMGVRGFAREFGVLEWRIGEELGRKEEERAEWIL